MVQIRGISVGRTGYGLLGLTWRPVVPTEEHQFAALKTALRTGATFWNGGDFYGPPEANSLQMLRKYFQKYPEDADKVFLSMKGNMRQNHIPDCSPESVRKSVERCLEILPNKSIDIYQTCRVDPKVPIEDTVDVLATLVKEGKIGGIGLSEVSPDTIRRAHAIHPISAVETELSLWVRDALTKGVASTCAELGIPLIAAIPIGRGFLSGKLRSPEDIPENDLRAVLPRYRNDAFVKNLELVDALRDFARKKGCTTAQLAISWARNLGDKPNMPEILPIPGAATLENIEENAQEVSLTVKEEQEIDQILENHAVVGERYPGKVKSFVEI